MRRWRLTQWQPLLPELPPGMLEQLHNLPGNLNTQLCLVLTWQNHQLLKIEEISPLPTKTFKCFLTKRSVVIRAKVKQCQTKTTLLYLNNIALQYSGHACTFEGQNSARIASVLLTHHHSPATCLKALNCKCQIHLQMCRMQHVTFHFCMEGMQHIYIKMLKQDFIDEAML